MGSGEIMASRMGKRWMATGFLHSIKSMLTMQIGQEPAMRWLLHRRPVGQGGRTRREDWEDPLFQLVNAAGEFEICVQDFEHI